MQLQYQSHVRADYYMIYMTHTSDFLSSEGRAHFPATCHGRQRCQLLVVLLFPLRRLPQGPNQDRTCSGLSMTSDVPWIEKPSSQLTSALQSKIVLCSKGSSIQVAMHCESLVMSNILGGNGREVKQQIHNCGKISPFLEAGREKRAGDST